MFTLNTFPKKLFSTRMGFRGELKVTGLGLVPVFGIRKTFKRL